ncbi:hypothetical protein AK830_g8998 [Neonectria ditissima]|uniref:Uncharacterized protein n=1 Tax=Neonectria ditissima TaxID=78410 RepID=A0A0P7BA19_9HYPO|nr:hypothetical protein AK830_g8998 [Neonectria ditissima]
MKAAPFIILHAVSLATTGLAGDTCTADNCARFVTGTKPGIGAPLEYRVSLCKRILATTTKPAPVTVTSTLTKYTTKPPVDTTANLNTTATSLNTTATPTPRTPILIPRAVPPIAIARVAGGWGANVTSPCAAHGECDADGQCGTGYMCVYDGSCACGKRRCYEAAPSGCNVQMLAGQPREPPARGYRD